MISSALVLNSYLHFIDTTPVLWSLNIELSFYALIVILAICRLLSRRALLGASAMCALFAAIMGYWTTATALSASFCAVNVMFLFIGSLIYRVSTQTGRVAGGLYVAASVAIFYAGRHVFAIEHGTAMGSPTQRTALGHWGYS